jgi:hypothetical protein
MPTGTDPSLAQWLQPDVLVQLSWREPGGGAAAVVERRSWRNVCAGRCPRVEVHLKLGELTAPEGQRQGRGQGAEAADGKRAHAGGATAAAADTAAGAGGGSSGVLPCPSADPPADPAAAAWAAASSLRPTWRGLPQLAAPRSYAAEEEEAAFRLEHAEEARPVGGQVLHAFMMP